jgi:hypothetical protein
MYFDPFNLLTSDIILNKQYANIFKNTCLELKNQKVEFYNSLTNFEIQSKVLMDLLELELVNTSILIDIFNSKWTNVCTKLLDIDISRLKEKSRKTLILVRNKFQDTFHIFDAPDTASFLSDDSNWIIDYTRDTPEIWNDTILKRIAFFYKHVDTLVYYMEKHTLCNKHVQGVDLILFITHTRTVSREIREYLRLVSSL